MDFDEDMSGLQIEDLGEYFLQTDINDNWKGFSLGYTEEDQQVEQANAKQPVKDTPASSSGSSHATATSASSSLQHLTSPPLASISEMLKHGNGLGVGLGFGSPRKEFAALFQTGATPGSAKHSASDATMMNRATRDAMELADFTLEHKKPAGMSADSGGSGRGALPFGGGSIKPASNVKMNSSSLCQNIMSSDEDADANAAFGAGNAAAFKRVFDFLTVPCDASGCSTIGSGAPEDDRGFRKKSREKMRRQEVNVKFEELVELLGLSNRVRKSAILQEAVSAIKSLKRERDEMRRDRDRLQQEVSKLATCLQYSHLGSVAAANTVNMTPQQLAHLNASAQQLGGTQNQHQNQSQHQNQYQNQQQGQSGASASQLQTVHTHPLNVPCSPGTNCFPIGSAFSNLSSHAGSGGSGSSHSASAFSGAGQISIAPKQLKPASSAASYTPIAPDTLMK